METKKPGKPENYSDSQLKQKLIEFRKKNKGIISFLALEKETQISRKTWKRRMGEMIAELNKIDLINNNSNIYDDIPIPSIDLIINKFGTIPESLRNSLHHLNEVIISTHNENLKLKETLDKKDKVEEALIRKIEKLENENKKFLNEVAYYEKILIESTNSSMRKKLGIKSNLIEIHKKNQDSALSLEIEKEFPELFGDIDEE
ncbi:hypothetical protein ACULLL_09270 [Lysinibacillus irui]|uniref:hypothetical protein n=1 Tax=Lysinibacillus irui TaxID=2998077 RepID=UPI00404453D3